MRRDTAKQTPRETSSPSMLARIVSSSIGSTVTSLVVTPLNVVKVRLQANAADATSSLLPRRVVPCPRGCGTFVLYNGQLDCVLPKSAVSFFDASGRLTQSAKSALYSSTAGELSTFGMIRRIFLAEGLAGIYAGLAPTLVMAVPNTVLYFSTYDEIVWHLRRSSVSDSSYRWMFPLLAGGSARLLASSVTAPFEYLRTRQASAIGHNQAPQGLVEEFRSIIRTEGIGTLYRGLRPTLWRDVPFSSIYWVVLERMKEEWAARYYDRSMSPMEQAGTAFVNGAVAGMVAAACTTPFDVVKTRQQAVAYASTERLTNPQVMGQACAHDGATVYKIPHHSAGTFTFMRHILETEGVAGLWRGNQARMLKVAPACAIMISSYEFGKRILG